ncbi:MAG: patatin-like phospholipase family protein [Acidimicrobiaceae bacterium]|nr:patatin-like phospholipase family protein [Acidimicrobiaceae bacterium]MBO0748072.1 patatin-like phospholipase family protein [Acidimicrobiaceae bacterium]
MSHALVLGGGGTVGIGWEAGLLTGLADGGLDLTLADLVIGTSAGSVVGAHLRLGTDLAVYAKERTEAVERGELDLPSMADIPPGQIEAFINAVTEAFKAPGPEPGRAVIGRFAVEAEMIMTPERQMSYLAELAGRAWPEGFKCTAVETASGRFVVWDADSGIDLQLAVAASCAVPGIFPPVSVSGKRYMDGGMRSSINADMAKGHDTALVLVVVDHALPPGLSDPRVELMATRQQAELDDLASSGATVDVIWPDQQLRELTMWGLDLMDTGRAAAAFEAGRRRGQQEAPRLLERWS